MKPLTTLFLAAAAAVVAGTTGHAQYQTLVGVVVHPAAPIDVVMIAEGHAGTTLTTTDRAGRGSFNVAALANGSKFAVYEEKCASATRVLLVADGSAAPASDNCRRRKVGAYDPLSDGTLTVKLASGLGTVARTGLAASAGAGALIVKGLVGGDPERPIDPPRPGGQVEIPPPPPSTSAIDGRFSIVANRATDTCGTFSPSFSGEVEIKASGTTAMVTMKERITRSYAGPISNTNVTAQGGGTLGSHSYQGTMNVQVIGTNSITGTETLNLTAGPCADKTVSYRFNGNRLP